jgi:NAD(P)-dependent dehydrogenase (short-subunit alcohol dehydrogenase family)
MKKIVVITGANGNMGLAVARRFFENGYLVEGADASARSDAFVPNGAGSHYVVDLMNEDAASAFVQSVIDRHLRIDVAVHTVGGFAMGSIVDTKTSDITHQYKLNFETAYNVARPIFLQMMKQGGGRLFLVGARPALSAAGSKGMIAYGLAKSMIFRLAEMMNDEAKGTNVSVAVVVPSIIDTPQNRSAMPDADFSKWVTTEQIVNAIVFHASEQASALREPVIKVYGGV